MSKYGIKPDRRTFYSHRDHVLNPDPAFTAVEPAKKRDIEVKPSSNVEFLEEIRDTALAKARANPETVTIEQGLKAAGILEGRKQQSVNQINLLVQVATGRGHQAYVVDGEAREVS